MKINPEENSFLSKWNKYEVARYVPALSRVIRDKDGENPLFVNQDDIPSYASKNNNVGIYTSVFAYDTEDITKATRFGPLYFDIDSDDLNSALRECIALYKYLCALMPKESIVVYFTGKKGFHIECEPVTLGINPSNSLPKVFRFIAASIKESLGLVNLDFSVYDLRRMWRLPGSKHQETNLYKTQLNPNGSDDFVNWSSEHIVDYAKQLRPVEVPAQSFNYKANEWYRECSYKLEEESKRKDDPLEYFNKYGSKAFKDLNKTEKVFDPKTLMTKCSAIPRLYRQAKETGYLEHEARLFLCSILTYTEDSIKFLHEILSQCHDYNFEKSSAHINDWIKRRQMGIGGRPYTCERANSAGVGCGDCSLEHKNKWVRIGDRYVETQEKNSPSPVRFAYRSVKKENE
jgi:hypothetical protein